MNAWQWAGWTMLHYLWIGAAIGVVTALVRRILRGAAPQVRYGVMLASLGLLTLAPLAVAWKLSDSVVASDNSRVATRRGIEPQALEQVEPSIPLAAAAAERSSPAIFVATPTAAPLLDRIASYLPALWLIGAPLTFLLLATGLVGADRLKRSAVVLTSGVVRETCEQVRTALKLSRSVAVAASDRVLSPVLVGILRPMILLPASALSGWSPEELELILTHELAHVRRWDNAVNLGQRVVESLLFFQPAVWVVSRWMRHDREECCDAVVVRHTGRPHDYADLLLAAAAPQPVVFAGAAMARSPVAARVRKILNLPEETMLVSRSVLLLGLLSVGLVAGVALRPEAVAAQEESTAKDANTAKAAEFAKEEFRYEGKSFEEWNRAWRTELSPERRVEAVKALGAFAKVGYEREAVESLLAVAKEYEWKFIDGSPEGQVRMAIVTQLNREDGGSHIRWQVWLPELTKALLTDSPFDNRFGDYVIGAVEDTDVLREIALNATHPLRSAAISQYLRQAASSARAAETHFPTPEAVDFINSITRDKDPKRAFEGAFLNIGGLLEESNISYFPQLTQLILYPRNDVACTARKVAARMGRTDQEKLVKELVAKTGFASAPKQERLAAIRGLAALPTQYGVVSPEFTRLMEGADDEIAVAAAVAYYNMQRRTIGTSVNILNDRTVVISNELYEFVKKRSKLSGDADLDVMMSDFNEVLQQRMMPATSTDPQRKLTTDEDRFVDYYLEVSDLVLEEYRALGGM